MTIQREEHGPSKVLTSRLSQPGSSLSPVLPGKILRDQFLRPMNRQSRSPCSF